MSTPEEVVGRFLEDPDLVVAALRSAGHLRTPGTVEVWVTSEREWADSVLALITKGPTP